MCLIWIIPCAVAQNITTILISRFFIGLAGSVFLSVAGGTIGDMFVKSELSMPMMVLDHRLVYHSSHFANTTIGLFRKPLHWTGARVRNRAKLYVI